MPWSPAPLCSQPGCHDRAVRDGRGRCRVHQRTTTQRGYGADHVAERTAALPGASCAACGRTGELQRDHIVRTSMGGGQEPGNKRWLCRSCHDRLGVRRDRTGRVHA